MTASDRGPAPTVSVVMPIYNGAAFLDDAVATIRSQTRPPDEVVVVDDGSTDDTAERVASLGPPFCLVRQPNQGPSAARNRGLREARGDVLAFLDVDDLWPPDKLEAQLDVLEREPEVDVVQGLVEIVPWEGERLDERHAQPHYRVNLGSGLYRRRAFERVGDFDAELRFGEDLDWFVRAREAGLSMRWLRQVTLIYRRHPGNMTRGRDVSELGLFGVLKRSMDRRRAAASLREGAKRLDPVPLSGEETTREEPASALSVSVIIPAYNAASYLAEAVASVRGQTRRVDEIIVVDDGSDDATREIARGLEGVRLIERQHRGVAAARNAGLAAATGDVIAWLDADDLWPESALASQLARLGTERRGPIVVGAVREFDVTAHPSTADLGHLDAHAGPPRSVPVAGAVVARRELFERVGPFDESLRVGAFMDWFLRARDADETIETHADVVLFRRLHGDNLGRREARSRRDYLRALKASLDRRRAARSDES